MQDSVFSRGIRRLEAAYRTPPCSEETLKVYWEKLKGFSDEWFEEVVNKLIASEKYFPPVASFLQYRGLEQKRCPVCGAKDWISWIDDRCGKCYRKAYKSDFKVVQGGKKASGDTENKIEGPTP